MNLFLRLCLSLFFVSGMLSKGSSAAEEAVEAGAVAPSEWEGKVLVILLSGDVLGEGRSGRDLERLLDEADKARLLSACSAALAPGGSFLLIDVLREDGQSREDYLTAYLGMMRGEWTAVPAEMIEEACNHVAAHDQPSSLAELSALAEEAGLGRITLLANYRQHHLIRFER